MKLIVFSGTSEGRSLCEFLSSRGVAADVFVATEYGEAVMEPLHGITIHMGRLTVEQMIEHMNSETLVVDATHPYASLVTDNVKTACTRAEAEYIRLLRPKTASEGVVTVENTAEAVRWLTEHGGKVLLTTGSKELEDYQAVPDYKARLYPRVLPSTSVLEKCTALGFSGSHIMAMQGPFSHELNVAVMRQIGAEILVTKDTGTSGGFAEKLSAARQVGATVLMIARPYEETGMSFEEVQEYLKRRLALLVQGAQHPRFPLFVSLSRKKVLVVGAGTIAARRIQVLRQFDADILVVAPQKRADFDAVFIERAFKEEDLDDAYLVIAATDSRAVNQRVGVLCASRHIPVSVADCAKESSFFFPAVCFGNGLIAGVVSDGTAHHAVAHAAQSIRTLLEDRTHGTN